jgi:hypothetical protein
VPQQLQQQAARQQPAVGAKPLVDHVHEDHATAALPCTEGGTSSSSPALNLTSLPGGPHMGQPARARPTRAPWAAFNPGRSRTVRLGTDGWPALGLEPHRFLNAFLFHSGCRCRTGNKAKVGGWGGGRQSSRRRRSGGGAWW